MVAVDLDVTLVAQVVHPSDGLSFELCRPPRIARSPHEDHRFGGDVTEGKTRSTHHGLGKGYTPREPN